MHFVKTDDLKPGMRLAKPIYNRMGVMLYERDTKLTQQGINSILNFGLIGIYVLEPAEPVPPITQEEMDFEQFQTIAMFQIRDDMVMLKNKKPPRNLYTLVQEIIKRYGLLDHKISFAQNIRSSTDFVYKHSISCGILAALISHEMKLNYADQSALVYAALLYDFGLLLAPSAVFEKGSDLSKDEQKELHLAREKGLALLDPEDNSYNLPDKALALVTQMIHNEVSPDLPLPSGVRWLPGTRILQVIDKFDQLTSMSLNRSPVSEILAMRYLMEYPGHYPPNVVNALARCIHILPVGACVDLSNNKKALVVAENPVYFLSPVILDFESNELLDLSKPEIASNIQISDIMRTMDNRISIDRVSLEHFSADERIMEVTERFRRKKMELEKRAAQREAEQKRLSEEQAAAHAADVERLRSTPVKRAKTSKNQTKRI